MEGIYLILVSICFILFGIASFFIVQTTKWTVFELFILLFPIAGIAIALSSLARYLNQKQK